MAKVMPKCLEQEAIKNVNLQHFFPAFKVNDTLNYRNCGLNSYRLKNNLKPKWGFLAKE